MSATATSLRRATDLLEEIDDLRAELETHLRDLRGMRSQLLTLRLSAMDEMGEVIGAYWEWRLTQYGLTARERDVLRLTARGYAYKEVGQRLGISPHTVKNVAALALKQLDAVNQLDALGIILGLPRDEEEYQQ